VDFYDASVFLWLDVDAQLRAHSDGKATLDDFTHRFYSGNDGKPEVKPYVENDLYTTLASIAPADWRGIIRKHLDVPDTKALLEGLKHTGWQLSYSAEKNSEVEISQKIRKTTRLEWSIGFNLDEKGVMTDVIEGRAAALGGAGPGMTLVAVNGKKFTAKSYTDKDKSKTWVIDNLPTGVQLAPGQSKHITITLDSRTLSQVDDKGVRAVTPGSYRIALGGAQPSETTNAQTTTFTIEGTQEIPR